MCMCVYWYRDLALKTTPHNGVQSVTIYENINFVNFTMNMENLHVFWLLLLDGMSMENVPPKSKTKIFFEEIVSLLFCRVQKN